MAFDSHCVNGLDMVGKKPEEIDGVVERKEGGGGGGLMKCV